MLAVLILCIIIMVFVLVNTVLVVTLRLLNKKIASTENNRVALNCSPCSERNEESPEQ